MPSDEPTLVGHVDLDAFFAALEQRDKPSLRGRPVVVGGTGPRGVVATASYEARAYGVQSAMAMSEARRRCPHAAVLAGRFEAYRVASLTVMQVLRAHSPQVEQVSLDEAYLVLPAPDVRATIDGLRAGITAATRLTASVGAGSTKLVAKIASDLAKPDGVLVVPRTEEQAFLDPLPIRRLPGVGPASEARLARLGIRSVAQLRGLSRNEVVALLGDAHGGGLWSLAHGIDERAVVPEHEVKSVSVEQTFEHDLTDPDRVREVLDRMAETLAGRLREARTSGRTVTLKARYPDFTTITRSSTQPGPTDDARVLARTVGALLAEVEVGRGLRLLGIGVSGLTPWVQHHLFEDTVGDTANDEPGSGSGRSGQVAPAAVAPSPVPAATQWRPGQDVVHDEHGPGWVWGSGRGRVTVRFETPTSPPGPVRTFDADDLRLRAAPPPHVPPVTADEAGPQHRPAAGPPPPPPDR